jgi:predicted membrane metal-binding protein
VTGGLRANLYLSGRTEDIADDFLAGDPVQILMKARQPRDFKDPGAFDVRGYLARQRIDLTGALRSGELLEYLGDAPVPWRYRFAILRGELLTRIDALFPDHPDRAAVLRAMLLGDRSFVDNGIVQTVPKTSA